MAVVDYFIRKEKINAITSLKNVEILSVMAFVGKPFEFRIYQKNLKNSNYKLKY